ncbi:MAG: hypothetical protein HY569_02250 [Candidatus Magasanikbacteria bacterium]|nr:hypothetical protein [Candidatus Magasanikbacteria bacterium]
MEGVKCNYWRCANRIGLFLALLFILCFTVHYFRPVDAELRVKLFQMAFFGFSGMNFVSFVLGLIQSYIYAYIGLGLWFLVGCCLKSGVECEHK